MSGRLVCPSKEQLLLGPATKEAGKDVAWFGRGEGEGSTSDA